MVEAYITFIILVGASAVIVGIMELIPEKYLQKLWVKLHLDNDKPYDDIEED